MLLIPFPRAPGNKEARKSLLPLWQLQTFSQPPSWLAVAHQPLQAVFTPPTPVLSLRSNRSPSLSSQPRPPRQVSRQASRAGECWSAPILCAGISLLCPLHPCCCALLCGSEASRLRHPQSPPAKGLPSVWKPFLLHSSLPVVQVPSLFFCLCFSFFFFPTQVRGEFLAFWKV